MPNIFLGEVIIMENLLGWKALNKYASAINLIRPLKENSQFGSLVVDKDILNCILNEIPINYDNIDKAIYIYIKTCYELHFSIRFILYDDIILYNSVFPDPQADISMLNSDFKDTECYRTSLLLQILYKEFLGIDSCIIAPIGDVLNPFEWMNRGYGCSHRLLVFKSGEYVVEADTSISTLGGLNDLYNVKTFTKLVGLNCINNDDETVKDFNNRVRRVYKEFFDSLRKKKMVPKEINAKYIRDAQTRDAFIKHYANRTFDDRFNIFGNALAKSPFSNVEFLSSVLTSGKNMFKEEERRLRKERFSVYFIKRRIKNKSLYMGPYFDMHDDFDWEVVVVINSKNGGNIYQEEGTKYYMYDKTLRTLIEISPTELSSKMYKEYFPINGFTLPFDNFGFGDEEDDVAFGAGQPYCFK